MTIHCAYSDVLPIAELKAKFHPKNPNQHTPEQIDRLAKIMAYQGVRKAAVISKRSGLITAGHGRILSAEKAGLETYPVDYQDYESEEQEYADLTADNAIAAWSELDLVGINDEALKLESGFDLDLLGIEDFIPANFSPGTEEDQGQLDQKKFVFMECPHCNKQFEKGQARVIED